MCTTASWVWYRFGPTRVPTMSSHVGDGVYTFVLRILSFVQIFTGRFLVVYLLLLSLYKLLRGVQSCSPATVTVARAKPMQWRIIAVVPQENH